MDRTGALIHVEIGKEYCHGFMLIAPVMAHCSVQEVLFVCFFLQGCKKIP